MKNTILLTLTLCLISANSVMAKDADLCGEYTSVDTGEQRIVDTAGRVEKFKTRMAKKVATKK